MIQPLSRSQAVTVPDARLIDDIRAASRQMVRELGFMDATLAATGPTRPPRSIPFWKSATADR